MESIITRKKYSVGKATKQGLKLHNEDIQYITNTKPQQVRNHIIIWDNQ